MHPYRIFSAFQFLPCSCRIQKNLLSKNEICRPFPKYFCPKSLELQVHTTNYNTNTLHRSISVIWHTWKLSCAYHTTTGHPVNAQQFLFPCVSLSGEAAKKTKQWLAMDWKVRAFWEVGREVQNVTLFPTVRTFVRFFNKKIYEGA